MRVSSARYVTLGTLLACTVSVTALWAQASVEVLLHAFPGNPTPAGAEGMPGTATARLLQAANGFFYGTATQAGPLAAGAVFVAAVLPNGLVVGRPLHFFDGTDGRWPARGLIQARDGAFYGTTVGGGTADMGTVFKLTAQGQFTRLHSFSGVGDDGAFPAAALVEALDGSFYGTTLQGGTGSQGTAFKITSAGAFITIHSFGTGDDGTSPNGALVQATDGNFYGTTNERFAGTVFRMTPDGTVSTLHRFTLGTGEGQSPVAGLIQGQDGALYGTTTIDSILVGGSVFRITTAGDLTILHSFPESSFGGVIQGSDGAFYGTTLGTVFRLTSGGDFTVLHTFNGPDGRLPYGGLIQARDGRLYGMTTAGGAADHGVVFGLTTDGVLVATGSFTSPDGEAPSGGVIRGSDGNLYGTTARGGPTNQGTVFRMTPDGEMTLLHVFTGPGGAVPLAGLVQASDGLFYGVTSRGGTSDRGTVYRMTPTGGFVTLRSFAPSEGGFAAAPLIQARDHTLYGTTVGDVNTRGIVFRITTTGAFTTFAALFKPSGPLVEASDGNFYGTTSGSGSPFGNQGTVFRMTPAGAVTMVFQFFCDPFGFCPDGAHPAGGLVQASDGNLYGTTANGGPTLPPWGTVFRVSPGGGLSTVHAFGFDAGLAGPTSGLIQAVDGRLYGTVGDALGGVAAVYSVSTGGNLAAVHVFSAAEGSSLGPLVEPEPGVLYGTAAAGGPATHGLVYRLTVPPGPP